ncbi:MAG: thioredoxin domain-containing protein [Cyanobacteria bacterium J06626_23]
MDFQSLKQKPLILMSAGIGIGVVAALAVGTPLVLSQLRAETVKPIGEPEATTDEEAAARAAWEAQQQHVQSVIQPMDRATLVGDSPTRGNLDASVVVVKFSDFQCPYCAVAAVTMKDFVGAHEADVLYVYKHFPLDSIHPEATPAAKATWAAQQQGQFWLYHDGLFAYQDRLSEDYYVELAEAIGLDVEQFNRDRNSPEAEAAVAADRQLAERLRLRGTPSFLMNDLMVPPGAPPEFFELALGQLQAQQE